MRRALVTGAAGFIGGHVVRRLAADGVWVRAVDRCEPRYGPLPADDVVVADLRAPDACRQVLDIADGFDEVYHLAADMGGMGFIERAECEVLHDNVLVDANMVSAASAAGARRYFFASSVCVYRDMAAGEAPLSEDDAYPAQPDNEYGWEKLYAERVALAHARRHALEVRIGRFQNCYGPRGAWAGGREKAPSAICRKVAEAGDGGTIEVWGDGTAVRSFIYVDDLVEAVLVLTRSDDGGPANIGTREYVTVKELVDAVADVAQRQVEVKWVPGPVGVRSRNFSNDRIESLGWRPRHSLRDGLAATYPWIEAQVRAGEAPAQV
ncbi:MAG: GDP-D-mannose 3, 5-epimerase [Actinomycetota bacterium]|nr:GDP-D-mannose 3, 5-epimerase [Actinomycetota bacterium]